MHSPSVVDDDGDEDKMRDDIYTNVYDTAIVNEAVSVRKRHSNRVVCRPSSCSNPIDTGSLTWGKGVYIGSD